MNNLHRDGLRPLQEKMIAYSLGLGKDFLEFEHVMEPFPNPILITTPDARIVYVNPAWEQLTGYKLDEIQGKNPNILKSGKTPRSIYRRMWRTLHKGKSFSTEEVIDKKKNGREYHINSTIFPLKKNGYTLFYIQIEQDITNRKKLEKLKKEFLSTATHELKTPITTLKLLIQTQLRRLTKREYTEMNTYELQLINKELTRLIRIIDDLSDVSRIEAGKLQINMKIVSISDVIKDAVHQMKTIASGHHIAVKRALPVYVIADEDRITQVLINLIKNAIKYSYPKSEVVIASEVQGKSCIVSVQNTGIGIARDKVPLIFDRFYQLQTGHNSGLGLGLYIAKKIVEAHKGKLWVSSVECKITTFYFSLPIVEKRGNVMIGVNSEEACVHGDIYHRIDIDNKL